MNDLCQCKDCNRPALHLGMCNKHWRRNRRYGSPFVTKNHVLKGLPADLRFQKLHKKIEGGCWEWIGAADVDGYGIFDASWNGIKYHRAHRFSWAFHSLSEIPKGLMVCHSCDNPKCVNPGHLWLGTAKENVNDMDFKKRRKARGELSYRSKLTEEQVLKILADPRPYAQIAMDYNVAAPTITSIKNRESWAHLEVAHIAKNKRGSGSGNRGKSDRITPDIVREIRASLESGKALATKFAVSPQLICAIRKRRAWNHIQE